MLAKFPQARHPAPARGMTFYNALLLGAMSVLMVFDTATRSRLDVLFFGDTALGQSLTVCFCVIIFFAGIAYLQRDIFILALFAAIIVLLLTYYLYFILGADRPLNFNALGSWYGLLTVIVFYVLAKRDLLPVAMKILFGIYSAYLLLYLALVVSNDLGSFSAIPSQKFMFVLIDEARGPRLFQHAAAAAYVAIYSIAHLQEKFRLRYIATLGLASYALYLSLSRGFIICVGSLLILYIITRRLTFVQYFSFISYLLLSVYLSIGVFEPSFNPYSITTSDESTIARNYEYQVVVPYIQTYPIFGIGLPDAEEGLTHYLGMVVYPDDLGIIGIWFIFGLFGVILFGIIAVYLCCMQNLKRSSAILGLANARTLSLTGCVIGLYAVVSNNLLTGSALVFSLILATALYSLILFAAKKRTFRSSFPRRQFRRLQPAPTQRPPALEPS
jgi:hypothetical protein